MMRQYLALKAQHPDALLFYRMGDFYELFFEDAERAAPLLEIALTTRDRGKPDAVPMCGVPVHAASAYVKRLTDHGLRVAICEQVEDPRTVGGRRLVRREVVEVRTPGLVGDPEGLDASREFAVVAIWPGRGQAGLACFDASTGAFRATSAAVGTGAGAAGPLIEELERIEPRELILPEDAACAWEQALEGRGLRIPVTRVGRQSFEPRQAPARPDGFDAEASDPDLRAAAAVLSYVEAHQPAALRPPPPLRRYALGGTMILDAATRRHLELFESSEDRTRRGTLIERIDLSSTPLGARLLGRWVAYPLLDPDAIRRRQQGVAWLAERDRQRSRLREALGGVRDLERILARCARPGAEPRDLAALRSSLAALPRLGEALAGPEGDLLPDAEAPFSLPVPLGSLVSLLEEALVADPRPLPRGSRGSGETGFIREGFRAELDGLRESGRKGREWIAGLEARERERLGVPGLRVRFHPVHGYTLELTKANLDRVPADYERKQTLANAERFTTAELRAVEAKVLGANERAASLEREILEDLRQAALAEAAAIRQAAARVAELDALQALAEVARRDGWVRPEVEADLHLEIRGGRHPVV